MKTIIEDENGLRLEDRTMEKYGIMDDGRLVYEDENGTQYLKCKIERRYYFVQL